MKTGMIMNQIQRLSLKLFKGFKIQINRTQIITINENINIGIFVAKFRHPVK